ncbi:MAG: glycosyltransferase [Ginsengibacter sp.]
MKPKKIVWLAHEANVSGANLGLKEFMQVASHLGYKQILILPHKGNMENAGSELKIPVKIISYYPWIRTVDSNFFDRRFVRRFIRNSLAVFQLVKIILSQNANIIFTSTSVINIGAIASFITFRKHIWYVHEMGEEDFGFKLPWGKWSYRFMNFFSKKILANSYHLAKKYKDRLPSIKINVIRYPVFVNTNYTPVEWNVSQPVRLLIIGQIAETKGHLIAIEALKILIAEGFDVRLKIIGKCEDPAYMQRLADKIRHHQLEEFVLFEKFTNSPHKSIADHHILLMCSKCEAFGRVTVEAMKLGVPVVGANTCGTIEIIKQDQTGLLFQQGNIQSLADKISIIIKDRNLREKLIINAKIYANQISNETPMASLLQQI